LSKVFHRSLRGTPPIAIGGTGVYVIGEDGRRYLDASGGAAVSCLGHGHARIQEAMKRQIDALAYAHSSFFTTEAAEALAEALVARAPGDLGHAYFVSGGSEAVEAALKMARQYFLEIGQPARRRFISRRMSYHGNTLGALAAGGNAWRREPFAPLLTDVAHISPCFAYRFRREGEREDEFGRRVANELEAEMERLGPETVAAFIAEPVVGATLGAVPAVPGYFARIREICDRHGALLIFDEVMCGMGRTGTLHACEQESVAPDLMTIAKGLGAGYAPIGAVLVSDRIYRAFKDGSGFFQHGHTYSAHPVACAAALEVQRVLAEEGLLKNVVALGALLSRALQDRFGDHPSVGDIRGRGLFQAIELVRDRATKEPFPSDTKLHARIKARAMELGLMVYPMGGTADGKSGDHVLMAPPFIAEPAHIEELVDKLARAIEGARSP
jgi:adenosylmethionine-8-amino-7-oxononanoate aminotransferase